MLNLALSVIIALVVIGFLLWLINTFLGAYMMPQILNLMNVAVVVIVAICLVMYILAAFGVLSLASGPPVPKLPMSDDDRIWLIALADALDKAKRHRELDHEGEQTVAIAISDELARGVADRLRAIAEAA